MSIDNDDAAQELDRAEIMSLQEFGSQPTVESLQPVIDEYESGDIEVSGLEVAATLRHFCKTGEVVLDLLRQESVSRWLKEKQAAKL